MRTAFASAAVLLAGGLRCSGESFRPDADSANGGSPSDGGSDGLGGEGATSGGTAGIAGTSGSGTSGGGQGASGGASGASNGGSDSGGQGDGGASGASGAGSCDEVTPCSAGRYCGSEGVCLSCADITSFEDPRSAMFGAPEPLSIINDAAGDWFLRSPRAFGSGHGLLYVRDFFGGEIWLTGNAETDVGAPLRRPVNEDDFLEGSPLFFELREDSVLGPVNFVFNRAADASSPHELRAANLAPSGATFDVPRLPEPFNPTPAFSEAAYAMAISHRRAWWTVNRDLAFAVQILTAPLDEAGPPSIVPLSLSDDCALAELDYGPWVTPDGKLLFVHASERDAACAPLAGQPKDIFVFRLNESGQPLGPAIPLFMNRPGLTELDPSLSPDLCTLYFVTTIDDKLRIMRARRTG
jgi:hypothetical protein